MKRWWSSARAQASLFALCPGAFVRTVSSSGTSPTTTKATVSNALAKLTAVVRSSQNQGATFLSRKPEAMKLLNHIDPRHPLIEPRSTLGHWDAQFREIVQLVRNAAAFEATTATPRVKECVLWVLQNRTHLSEQATMEAMWNFGSALLRLADGAREGHALAREIVLPLVKDASWQLCVDLKAFNAKAEPKILPANLRLRLAPKSIAAPFHFVRVMTDKASVAASAEAHSTSATPRGDAAAVRAIANSTVDDAPIIFDLFRNCVELINSKPVRDAGMEIAEWQDIVGGLRKVHYVHAEDTWGSSKKALEVGGREPNVGTALTASSTSPTTASQYVELIDGVMEALVSDIERPHGRGSSSHDIGVTAAPLHAQGAPRASDLCHLIRHLLRVSGRVTLSTQAAVHALLPLLPLSLKNCGVREAHMVIGTLAKVILHPAFGRRSVPASLLDSVLDRCRAPLHRGGGLKATEEAVGTLWNLARLRSPVPVDIVALLCQSLTHTIDQLSVAQIALVASSLATLCDLGTSPEKNPDSASVRQQWTVLRDGTALHLMHLMMQRIQGKLDSVTNAQSIQLLDAYCTMNNSTTAIEMYQVLRPKVDEFVACSNLTVSEINSVAQAISSLSTVATSTTLEEDIVTDALRKRITLLASAVAKLERASGTEVAGYLSIAVDVLCQAKRHAGTAAASGADDDEMADDSSGCAAPSLGSTVGDTPVAPLAAASMATVASPQEMLRAALDAALRCAPTSTIPSLIAVSRSVSRVMREHLLPQAACRTLNATILATFLRGTASTSIVARMEENPDAALAACRSDVCAGPLGQFYAPDCATFSPLAVSLERNDLGRTPEESTALWALFLRRIALTIGETSVRDTRIVAHMLGSMDALWRDAVLSKHIRLASIAAIRRTVDLVQGLSFAQVAAFVASLNMIEAHIPNQRARQTSLSDDGATNSAAASDDRGEFPEAEFELLDEVVGSGEEKDSADAVAQPSLSDGAALYEALNRALVVLAHRAIAMAKQASSATTTTAAACTAVTSTDLRLITRMLYGFAESTAADSEVAPVFYAMLSLLRSHCTQLQVLDLSIALSAFAKAGVWNVLAMEALIEAVHDGVAAAAPKQCIALLQTMVNTKFIRRGMVFGNPLENVPSKHCRGAHEAMERLVVTVCNRLQHSVAQLGPRGCSAVLGQLLFFDTPPQPLFDSVAREVARQSLDVHLSLSVVMTMLLGCDRLRGVDVEREVRSAALRRILSDTQTQEAIARAPIKSLSSNVSAMVRSLAFIDLDEAERRRISDLISTTLLGAIHRCNPVGLADALLLLSDVCDLDGTLEQQRALLIERALKCAPHLVSRSVECGAWQLTPSAAPLWSASAAGIVLRVSLLANEVALAEWCATYDAFLRTLVSVRHTTRDDKFVSSLLVVICRMENVGLPMSGASVQMWEQEVLATLQSQLEQVSLDALHWALRVLARRNVLINEVPPHIRPLLVALDRSVADRWCYDSRNARHVLSILMLAADRVTVEWARKNSLRVSSRLPVLVQKMRQQRERGTACCWAPWIDARLVVHD